MNSRGEHRYQSSFISGFVIALFGVLYLFATISGERCEVIRPTLLAEQLLIFETQHLVLSRVMAGALLITGAILAMRIAIRFNIYGRATHLPAIIYLGAMATLATPDELLLPQVAAIVMMLSMFNLYDGYTHFKSAPQLFGGCFWLGVLPSLYPAMLPLGLLLFIIMVLFERSGRELILALGAFVTPLLIELYIKWLLDNDVASHLSHISTYFINNEVSIWREYGTLALLSVVVLAIIYIIPSLEMWSLTLVARKRIIYAMSIIVVALLTPLMPSFVAAQFAILAAPIAITLTTALIMTREKWATICYVVFIAIVLISRVLP